MDLDLDLEHVLWQVALKSGILKALLFNFFLFFKVLKEEELEAAPVKTRLLGYLLTSPLIQDSGVSFKAYV